MGASTGILRRAQGALALLAVLAAPAAAQQARITLPGGTLGEALAALGRQAAVSAAVDDPILWRRPVPPTLAGSPEAAVRMLARAAGARARRAGPAVWRLTALARPAPPRAERRGPPPAPGRQDDAPPPEDVVVTASKRNTPLGWYGGSVTSVGADELAFGGLAGTGRVAQRTTGLGSTHLGEGRDKLFIRGLADSSFTGPAQALVGQYLGDLRLGYSGADPSLQLYDVRSVEVLEGPQGTLYGSGALGGIVRVVPADPDPAAAGGSASLGVSATALGEPGADAAAMLNLPISDGAAVRLVGYAQRHGGYIDKPLLDARDVNRADIAGGRAALGAELGGGWRLDIGAAGQRIRGRDSQYADEAAPPLVNLRALREGYDTAFGLGQASLGGALGAVRVRATLGAVGQRVTERFDATSAAPEPTLLIQEQRSRMTTGEVRAWQEGTDGGGWLAGASLIRHRRDLERRFVPPVGSLAPGRGGEAVGEETLYGEGGVALWRWLVASGGLRFTSVAIRDRTGAPAANPFAADDAGDDRVRRQRVLLPSAALTARRGGASLYLRYQQGFRPGGLTVEADRVRRFRSDRLYAAELGARLGDGAADRWSAAASVARSRWHGIQANFLDPYGLPGTANLGNGTVFTAEAWVRWRPAPAWHFDLGTTLNWSRITAFTAEARAASQRAVPAALAEVGAQALRLGGDVPNVADGTARAGAGYRGTPGGRPVSADLWLRYVGRSRLGVGPYLGERQGGYLDSAASVRVGLGAVGLSLSAENLTDARGDRFALGTPFRLGLGQATPLRPRTVRLGIDTSF